jgi:TRAP-type C4-dicarboxylate transport system substrate-binding protein
VLTRRTLLAGAVALGAASAARAAPRAGVLRLRVATDVNVHHILTQTFRTYLDRVQAAFPQEVRVELFHSGQLYADRDMARAVMRGDLDMAAPAIMSLARIVPEFGITSLPPFYARGADAIHRAMDGAVGAALNRKIAQSLGAIVPGPYLDLGPIDLFMRQARPGTTGLKVRVPSGAGIVLRLRALGSYPVTMPFSDVPIALAQGAVDAIESTAETVLTAQLWDAGLRSCLREEAMFVQYVPLISGAFWRQASPALRQGMTRIWSEMVAHERIDAHARQAEARATCQAHGIAMYRPTPAAVAGTRARLLPLTDSFVASMGIDPAFAATAFGDLA